jgi:hypothetical protein
LPVSTILAAKAVVEQHGIDAENILIYTVPPVVASLLALVGTVWVARIGSRNTKKLERVEAKVTTPGDGTLGETVQAVADHTLPPGGA